MSVRSYDRVVIGGGLFGAYSSLLLSRMGHSVLLVEQNTELMGRASYVNQARLHTGLHYPRSIVTAKESLNYYKTFRERFPTAVFDFHQIYAISKHNSKTSGRDFLAFIDRLNINYEVIDESQYFNSGTVNLALSVEEPTFDAKILRNLLLEEINLSQNLELNLNTSVIGGEIRESESTLLLSDEAEVKTAGIVIASYAGINPIRKLLGLPMLPLTFELAEIILGTVTSEMMGIGITVMDGPFWSIMPFGNTGAVSLTSVGNTPLLKSKTLPVFQCQSRRTDCTPLRIADCNNCDVKPSTSLTHHIQQMKLYLKNQEFFTPKDRLVTVKSILSTTEIDDARPTLIQKEPNLNVWTVFSGKVSTLFDLEGILK